MQAALLTVEAPGAPEAEIWPPLTEEEAARIAAEIEAATGAKVIVEPGQR